jgi:hypothetical protein
MSQSAEQGIYRLLAEREELVSRLKRADERLRESEHQLEGALKIFPDDERFKKLKEACRKQLEGEPS